MAVKEPLPSPGAPVPSASAAPSTNESASERREMSDKMLCACNVASESGECDRPTTPPPVHAPPAPYPVERRRQQRGRVCEQVDTETAVARLSTRLASARCLRRFVEGRGNGGRPQGNRRVRCVAGGSRRANGVVVLLQAAPASCNLQNRRAAHETSRIHTWLLVGAVWQARPVKKCFHGWCHSTSCGEYRSRRDDKHTPTNLDPSVGGLHVRRKCARIT